MTAIGQTIERSGTIWRVVDHRAPMRGESYLFGDNERLLRATDDSHFRPQKIVVPAAEASIPATNGHIGEEFRKDPEPFAACQSCTWPTNGDGVCINRECSRSLVGNGTRLPWPGTDYANVYDASKQSFAEKYDPPTGTRYLGEYRVPLENELILNKKGRVQIVNWDQARIFRRDSLHRHLLVYLPGVNLLPYGGSDYVGPAS